MNPLAIHTMLAIVLVTGSAAPPATTSGITRLLDGNGRYAATRSTHPHQDRARREGVAAGAVYDLDSGRVASSALGGGK
jgi:hypothetical protein